MHGRSDEEKVVFHARQKNVVLSRRVSRGSRLGRTSAYLREHTGGDAADVIKNGDGSCGREKKKKPNDKTYDVLLAFAWGVDVADQYGDVMSAYERNETSVIVFRAAQLLCVI